MTVYTVISLPQIPLYTVYIWFWPTLLTYMHPHVQFNEMKDKNDGCSPFLTPQQSQWLSIQQMLSLTSLEVCVCVCLAM